MKKAIICLMLLLILLLGGCASTYQRYPIMDTDPFLTGKPVDYTYETCEPVELYLPNEKTGENTLVASVTIKNVLILDSGNVRFTEYDEVHCGEALIQVNYEIRKYRGEIDLNTNNIRCVDQLGTPCERFERDAFSAETVYTAYERMYFLVPVEGEYVDIQLYVGKDPEQTVIPIRCYYGVGEPEEDPAGLNIAITQLMVSVVTLLGLGIAIYFLYRKKKQMMKEYTNLQQKAMLQENAVQTDFTDGGAEV